MLPFFQARLLLEQKRALLVIYENSLLPTLGPFSLFVFLGLSLLQLQERQREIERLRLRPDPGRCQQCSPWRASQVQPMWEQEGLHPGNNLQ